MSQQTNAAKQQLESQAQLSEHTLAVESRPSPSFNRRNANSSRDEMNLAEFPLTVLSTRVGSNVKTLEFKDSARLPGGEVVERKWIITGADKFGLPTATDDDVVLGLIRMTMDQEFRDRKVYFTRYELLKTLRWSTEGRSYTRLIKSLDRLSGVRIRSTNSFYDNTTKSYQTCNFGIIDAYEINNEKPVKNGERAEPRKSFFIWSEMIFDSFKAGFIKKIDLDLYFSLKSAVSRRLYRYLDKHFYYKSSLELPLLTLAFEKIGLSRTYKYVSSIKQQLEPAAEELVRLGFLSSFQFNGRGEQTTVRFTSGSVLPAVLPKTGKDRPLVEGQILSGNAQEDPLIGELVQRGISEMQVKKLLAAKSAEERRKITEIVKYYDKLVANNDRRVSRNKVGFLYRAVESPYKFYLPGFPSEDSRRAPISDSSSSNRSLRPELRIFKASAAAERKRTSEPVPACEKPAAGDLEAAYRDFVEHQVSGILNELDPPKRMELYRKIEHRMQCFRSSLSAKRFQEIVEKCVREEVQRHYGVADFNSWLCRNTVN